MIIPMVRYGATGGNVLPAYTYTGTTPTFASDSEGNWELAFQGDCEITFSKIGAVDIFVVAGGMSGGNGKITIGLNSNYARVVGGNGGKGGGRVTSYGVQLSTGQNYTVTVGGSGQSSSAFGVTAESGAGANGGAGATGDVSNWNGRSLTNSVPGSEGAYAFGESTSLIGSISGRMYGAGGGGAGITSGYGGGKAQSAGGSTGGGAGGRDETNYRNGVAGAANTGSGGGGGEATYTNSPYGVISHTGNGGAGGSGIVIIRNART